MESEDNHCLDSKSACGSAGPSGISPLNVAKKVESSAWGIPHGASAHHASCDASLFSSSLPVLPHEKLNFPDSVRYGQPFDDNMPMLNKDQKEVEGYDPLEDVEINAIGNMLPDDEDELLAGITEDFDLSRLPSQLEDLDENDLFGSGGGLEMDFEPQESLKIGISKMSITDGVASNGTGHYVLPNGVGPVAGEHPYGEHPSRTLFVRNINSNVEDSELRSLFEDNPSDKDINQGTLVVFNLDPSVSNDDLRLIFGAYGEVKEIRETPHKRHHKFIEFYDVRAAEGALKALNRCDIAGKRIKLEPSRPGGARRNLMQQLSQELDLDEARTFRHQGGSPMANSPPGNWAQYGSPVEHSYLSSFSRSPVNSNQSSGLAAILSPHAPNSTKIAPIGKDSGRVNSSNQIFTNAAPTQGVVFQNSLSFPELKANASSRPIATFGETSSTSSSIGTLSGPQFLWGSPTTSYTEHSNTSAWSSSSSAGPPFTSSGEKQGFPYTNRHSSILGTRSHHHVGSAPSGLPLDRHFSYFPESPETSFMSPVSYGSINHSDGNFINMGARAATGVIGLSGNTTEINSPSFRLMSLPRPSSLFLGNGFYSGGATNEGFIERGRSRRPENSVTQIDSKKQYQLDLDKIISGEDTRTTLMIKNIPNKYTSKMLLSAIDENHRGTYDFLYLPIDFKNKCNVGYAFINMVSASHIVPFYKEFNGKKWEKFNSEKVASLAYARIQGKAALVTHFQNSSLMNEDKRCRPILFHSEGQEIFDQEPLLSSNLNICIRQPDGSYSSDLLESPKGDLDDKL